MARTRKRKAGTTQVLTAGTTIKFEEPKSGRGKQTVTKVIVQEMNPVSGFVDFLREHAVVGLSIGFIIGTQMATFVRALVESFIDPMTKLLFGTALSQRTFTLEFQSRAVDFGWGNVVYNLLIILLLLLFIYVAIKLLKLDKFDKPKAEEDAAE